MPAKLAGSSLTQDYLPGALRLTVDNVDSFPTSAPFTVAISDPDTEILKLFFRVTGISGSTFFGEAEGTDAPASAGDLIEAPEIRSYSKRFIVFEGRF